MRNPCPHPKPVRLTLDASGLSTPTVYWCSVCGATKLEEPWRHAQLPGFATWRSPSIALTLEGRTASLSHTQPPKRLKNRRR